MIKTFTTNDMIQSLYGELSKEIHIDFENTVHTCNDTSNEFFPMRKTKELLDKHLYEPSANTIEAIMQYARSKK